MRIFKKRLADRIKDISEKEKHNYSDGFKDGANWAKDLIFPYEAELAMSLNEESFSIAIDANGEEVAEMLFNAMEKDERFFECFTEAINQFAAGRRAIKNYDA